MEKSLVGAWTLEAFDIEKTSGDKAPWGKNVQGLLIYTESGHVSVSINRDVNEETQNADKAVLDSLLFYAGTYSIDGETINHKVTLASNPSRVGRDMIRYAKFEDDKVTLSTPQESYGRAILVWRRVKQ